MGTIVGRCRDVCDRWQVSTWRLQDGAVADPLGDFLDGAKVFLFKSNTLIIKCVMISQGNEVDVWAPSINLGSRVHRVIHDWFHLRDAADPEVGLEKEPA